MNDIFYKWTVRVSTKYGTFTIYEGILARERWKAEEEAKDRYCKAWKAQKTDIEAFAWTSWGKHYTSDGVAIKYQPVDVDDYDED